MGWFDFWKRKPKPAEPIAPTDGPYTAADFPCPNPTPGHAGADSPHIDTVSGNDEIAFAVVMPRGSSTEQELTVIGLQLRNWQVANDFVRRIIGLEQLLSGTFPETPTEWLMLPMPPFTEQVALVFVAPNANTDETCQSLTRILEGLPATIFSPEFYSYINR